MKSKINVTGRVNKKLKQLASEIALNSILNLKQPDTFELTIKFVSEKEIKRLNKDYRNIDKVTDVLSFPNLEIVAGEKFSEQNALFVDKTEDGNYYLGDMAICLKQLARQAKEFKVSKQDELKKLVIHSILHLFGYDHIKDKDYAVMQKQEDKLSKLIEV